MKKTYSLFLWIVMTVISIAHGQSDCLTYEDVCLGEVITYTAPPQTNATYTWNVIGGTGASSGASSYTVTWSTVGTGQVTLIIEEQSGDISTCLWEVTVHPLPVPEIISSFSPSCRVDSTFTDHAAQDDRTECLIACDSSIVTYSTTLNPGSTYTWAIFGDISHTLSGSSVTVNWGSVGAGLIHLTEIDENGCIGETEMCVKIIESPQAEFSTFPPAIGGVIDICMSSTSSMSEVVSFNDWSTGSPDSPIANWLWNFGDGTESAEENPEHQFPGPGTYEVWLIVENECHCKDSISVLVNVSSFPGPDIYCKSTVCAGDTATYSTNAANCTDYNWVVGGGSIIGAGTGSSISVVWGPSGPGVVTLSVDGCDSTYCSTPTSVVIPILSPTVPVDGPDLVCAYTFNTYSVSNLPGSTYSWTITGGGYIDGAANGPDVNVYWYSSGTLTVTYENPELGCGGSGTLNITVAPPYSVYGPEKVCLGDMSTYNGTGSGPFDWEVSDETGGIILSSSGPSVNVNWATPGIYQVTATDNSGTYCNSPQSVFVQVGDLPPPPAFINGPDSICPGIPYAYFSAPQSSGYYLQWTITGGTPSTAMGNNVTITWGPTPPYLIEVSQVEVTSPNCESAPITKNISPATLPAISINGATTTCTNTTETYSSSFSGADSYEWGITPTTMGSITGGQGTDQVSVQWNNATGTAILTLKVKECTDSVLVNQTITLTPPPAAIINSVDEACQFESIVFDSPTSGDLISWDFGDNTTGSGSTLNHSYSTPGVYLVTLTITNPGGCIGSSSVSKYITIYEAPVANVTTPDPTSYCPGQTINTTLYVNTQPGNTFSWVGPGVTGDTSSFVTATSTGNYYVEVENAYGCVSTSNIISIQINCDTVPCNPDPLSSVDFTITPPACNTVSFSANITNGSLVGWNFGDPGSGFLNFSDQANPNHTYEEAGYYQVSLVAKVPGSPDSCQIADVQTVVIPAVAEFAWEVTGCSGPGFLFDFTDLSDVVAPFTINSWSWDFGGVAPISSSQNPTGVTLPPGNHTVTLTIISSAGTTCTISQVIDVPDLPNASFTSDPQVCEGNSISFTSTSLGSIVEGLWQFGDGAESALYPTTDRNYDTPGTYNVTLTVTDVFGCTSTVNQPIVVVPNTLNISIAPPGPIEECEGTAVQLSAIASGGTPAYSYLWSTLEPTPDIYPTAGGAYQVMVIDSDNCKQTSGPVYVTFNPAPDAIISGKQDYCAGELVQLTANQGPLNSYEWLVDTGSGFSTGGFGQDYYNYFSPGTVYFKVIVTGTNSCSDTSDVFTINIHNLPDPPVISASSSLLCSGTPITLNATSPQGYSDFTWNTGVNAPSISTTTPGLYEVSVLNEHGCESSSNIYINPMPDLSNFLTGCYEYCDTTDVLWIGPAGPYTYEWLKDGVSLGVYSQNYLVPAGASGDYQLVVNASGCVDTTDIASITFYPCIGCDGEAFIKSITCDSICGAGNSFYTINLVVENLIGADSYTLTTSTGTLTGFTPSTLVPGYNLLTGTFVPTTPGAQVLCVVVTLTTPNGLSCEIEVCVDVPPCDPCDFVPGFQYTVTDSCNVEFYGIPMVPSGWIISDMQWLFGDGGTSTVLNPVHHYSAVGNTTYEVCFTVTATNGEDTCTVTTCQKIEVDCEPVSCCHLQPTYEITQLSPCTFEFASTTIAPPGITIIGYEWDLGDTSTSTDSVLTHSYNPGTYKVCLTVYGWNGLEKCTYKVCFKITVDECEPCIIKPAFEYEWDGCKFQFWDQSAASPGTIYDWEWTFGTGASASGINNPVYVFPGPGIYTVCLTVYAKNGDQTCKETICKKIEVNDCEGDSGLSLKAWPNPSSGSYELNIEGQLLSDQVFIYDPAGNQIPFNQEGQSDQIKINLLTDKAGIYILMIKQNGRWQRTTLLKR